MNSFHISFRWNAQRVMIAIAIACKPDLLIATSQQLLDVTMQKQVRTLKELNKKLICQYYLSHMIYVASSIANKIIVMKDGRIVESKEKYFSWPS